MGYHPSTEQERAEAAEHGWCERRRLGPRLADLRLRLYLKAKREPKFRFYSLYDRIYRKDVLEAGWEQVRVNRGSAGVDGVTIHQIVDAEGGPERWLAELAEVLCAKKYQPEAVKRVYIPKPDGRERPLGIPTVRDRVVQAALLLIMEPIFEADFLDSSYGFRPGRKAHDALEQVRQGLHGRKRDVYDADLKGYFDSIPRDKLFKAIRMRVTDSAVLKLIRMWLNAPVIDTRDGGPPRRTRTGTPQGGVISPLLANIYLHWFDHFFHARGGPAQWAGAELVRYADDLVILARYQSPRLKDWIEETLEQRMGLELNRAKTRVVRLMESGQSFDFLGYTFRYDRDLHGQQRRYLNVAPSKKALARERQRLRDMTGPWRGSMPIPALVADLNRHLHGWAQYFSYGYPRVAKRQINRFVRDRLTRHLRQRSQRPFRPPGGVSYYKHFQTLGLVYL